MPKNLILWSLALVKYLAISIRSIQSDLSLWQWSSLTLLNSSWVIVYLRYVLSLLRWLLCSSSCYRYSQKYILRSLTTSEDIPIANVEDFNISASDLTVVMVLSWKISRTKSGSIFICLSNFKLSVCRNRAAYELQHIRRRATSFLWNRNRADSRLWSAPWSWTGPRPNPYPFITAQLFMGEEIRDTTTFLMLHHSTIHAIWLAIWQLLT